MKIGDILELLKNDIVANIAKREDVHLSEKPLRKALKSAGYEFRNSGQKGWYYAGTGDEASILEQSIYEYSSKAKATAVKTGTYTRKETSIKTGGKTGKETGQEQALNEVATSVEAGVNTGMNAGNRTGKGTSTSAGKIASLNTRKETGSVTGNSADVLDRLFAGLPATNDKKEVSFYLTKDVIEVINRAKKGNRSDLVNEALRKVFREKGWL